MSEWKIMLREREIAAFQLQEGEAVTIGRGQEADVVVDNPAVSRLHARFSLHGGEHRLTDLNSTNGTFINSEPLKGTATVDEADVVEIAKFSLVKVLSGEAEAMGSTTDLDSTVFIMPRAKEDEVVVKERPLQSLLRLQGSGKPPKLSLDERARVTLGKGVSCDVQVPGLFVGNPQCVIEIAEDGAATLAHSGGFRKTTVDGVAVTGRVKLGHGSKIAIAGTVYKVE
jgi:pSer/pThr/pTyr-binding forkhead associated (FHA) protein